MIALPLLVVACVAFQLRTVTTRSGEKQLELEEMGDGTSWLTLRDPGGRGRLWNQALPHSIAGAYLCEDGTVVAHGITHSGEIWSKQSFALTILDPRGKTLLLELHPFQTAISHVGALPRVIGFFVWESVNTCAFRVDGLGKHDQLWTYALNDGSRQGVIEPETLLARAARQDWEANLLEARPLDGTNLFLATFRCRTKMQGSPGSYVSHDLFGAAALLDTGGELLWWELMPEGRFLGSLREVSSSKDEHRWEADLNQVVEGDARRRTPDYECVGLLPLRFQRDAEGAWRKR